MEFLLNQGAYVNVKNNYSKTPLHLAVEEGSDEEIIKLLLNRGANTEGEDGITALDIAVRRNYLQIVKHLLKHGAYFNSASWKNCIPLTFVVQQGSEKIVQLLLEYGVVNAKGAAGIFVLHIAVIKGSLQIVEHLLKHGAYVNFVFREDNIPLYLAVEKGHEEVVKLLLKYEANIEAKDKHGKTILRFAVEKGRLVIIEHVLKHCSDMNNKRNRSAHNAAIYGGKEYCKIVKKLLQYDFTTTDPVSILNVNNFKFLYAAIEEGCLQIVEELLQYDIDVNMLYDSTSGKVYMPLHVATKNKREEVAKLLISYGADINAQDETGKAPIFYATQNADLKMLKLLLTNKANIKDNPELLYIAVENECREIIEVLLQYGADVNTSDKYGRTALHFTALTGEFFGCLKKKDPDIKSEIAKLLLSRGANVDARTKNGTTTLHAATRKGYMKIVEVLLEYNADVNSTIKTDLTPLHIAAQRGHLEIVEILLKFDASINSKDEHGKTALHFACLKGYAQIVIALLEHGSDINLIKKFDYTGKITEILYRHIIKMKTANLYVYGRHLLSIYCYYEIEGFRTKCEKEIATIKSEKIGNSNASFYDILTKSINQLAILLENENIVQILRSDDYKKKCPIYASMINRHIRKGERRKELLEQVNKNCYNIFPKLPYVCTQKVFSYLSDKDLRILIDVCQPTNVGSSDTNVEMWQSLQVCTKHHA